MTGPKTGRRQGRALAVALALALAALVLFPASALAAGPTVTAGPPTGAVEPGDEFTVDFALADNPGFWGATLTVTYDEDAMELTGFDVAGTLFASGSVVENVAGASIGYYAASTEADTTGDGTLFRANFKAKSAAAEGAHPISAELRGQHETNFINKDSRAVGVSFVPATVTIGTTGGGSSGDGGGTGGTGGTGTGGAGAGGTATGGGGTSGGGTAAATTGSGTSGTEADGSDTAGSGASSTSSTGDTDATGIPDATTPLSAAGTDAGNATGDLPWWMSALAGAAVTAVVAGAVALLVRYRNRKNGRQPV